MTSSEPSTQRAGKRLEKLIRAAASELEGADLARIWKWPEATAVQKKAQQCPACGGWNEGFEILWRERNGCDFFGYTAGARVILVEAKESAETSLSIGEKGLKPHQLVALRDAQRAGGIALLMWMNKNEVATIDADMIDQFSKDRKSIAWRSIPQQFKRFPKIGFLCDLFQPWI